MITAVWCILMALCAIGILFSGLGMRLVRAVEAIVGQVGLRREAQDQRIDDLQNMLFAHCEQLRHTHTPKRRKKAEQPTLTQS